jgi:hypothetical protein
MKMVDEENETRLNQQARGPWDTASIRPVKMQRRAVEVGASHKVDAQNGPFSQPHTCPCPEFLISACLFVLLKTKRNG